jgi:hypothetical protein
MVDAALVGFDDGEIVTIPALPDIADWAPFELARQKMIPNLSLNSPALRYGAGFHGSRDDTSLNEGDLGSTRRGHTADAFSKWVHGHRQDTQRATMPNLKISLIASVRLPHFPHSLSFQIAA